MKSILLNLPDELVNAVDKEATYNHLTRTGMIRRMLIAFLRPEVAGHALEHQELYMDQEELLKALRRQHGLVYMRQLIKDQRKAARAKQKLRREAKNRPGGQPT